MGSAFTAIEDDIAATFYNPATLNLYLTQQDHRITVFLNPLGAATFGSRTADQDENQSNDDNRIVKSLSLLLKGVAFTSKFVDVAFVLNEQLIDANPNFPKPRIFDNCDIWDNCYHSVAARFKLADRVSIGVAGSYYTTASEGTKLRGFGFSYGILLKPAPNLNVGLAFIDFPQQIPDVRLPLERMADQTMNIGVSYRPFSSTILSFDIRNLTEEQQKSVREAHFGIEQNIFSILAIRGGYFQEKFSKNQTYSVGLALFDWNLLFSKERQFDHPQFTLNYSYVHQKKEMEWLNYHILSFIVRI